MNLDYSSAPVNDDKLIQNAGIFLPDYNTPSQETATSQYTLWPWHKTSSQLKKKLISQFYFIYNSKATHIPLHVHSQLFGQSKLLIYIYIYIYIYF
jgi:hypothetical protein